MAIVQGDVKIYRLIDGELVGSGRCAMHVPESARAGAQYVSGTVMLQQSGGMPLPTEDEEEYRIVFADGREINVVFTKFTRTDCGPEILRFRGRSQHPSRSR